MSIQTVNPNTNKIVKSFEEMSEKAIDEAVAIADQVFASWRKTSFKVRSQLLNKVAQLIRHTSGMTKQLRKNLTEKQFPLLHIKFLSLNKIPGLMNKSESITGFVEIELQASASVSR